MLKLFILFELQKIKRYFETKLLAKIITSSLFVTLFLGIGLGMYRFFSASFIYINSQTDDAIKLALLLFLYELFLLVLTGISMFSAVITSLFSLFQGKNNNWIMSSPGYKHFPNTVFLKSLSGSTLVFFVMFLPAFFSIAGVYHLSLSAFCLISISIFFFSLIINTSTLLLLLLVTYSYYKVTRIFTFFAYNFKGLAVLLISLASLILVSVWKTVKGIDLMALFKGSETDANVTISSMASHFEMLPTHPFAMEIINFQTAHNLEALQNFVTLGFLAAVLTFFWFKLSRLHYPLWQKFQDGTGTERLSGLERMKAITYTFTGSIPSILFKKEALISTRNTKGVLWFFFLFSIWFMQLAANVLLNHNVQKYQDDISPRMVSLQMIQYIIAIYFISAFTLRFVFPSFSTERKTNWILGSAPISFNKIFFSKYIFYTVFFVALGILMNYCNAQALHLTVSHAFYSMVLFVTVIVFIVTLGIVLGVLFPNTETDDPEAISTSVPGLFFTALALMYGAASDGVLYLMLKQGNPFWLVIFVVFTIFVITVTLTQVSYRLRKKVS